MPPIRQTVVIIIHKRAFFKRVIINSRKSKNVSFLILFLYDVYRSKNNIFLSFFLNCGLIHSDTVDFWFYPVAWLLNRSVLPLLLSELFIAGCCRSVSLWVLISIKSTMIIVGGYHGIRLYEREVQPHDLLRHWYCQTQPFRRCHFFGGRDTHRAVQILKWLWCLLSAVF